jgi:hypothetical protein
MYKNKIQFTHIMIYTEMRIQVAMCSHGVCRAIQVVAEMSMKFGLHAALVRKGANCSCDIVFNIGYAITAMLCSKPSLIWLQLIHVSDNLHRNMKNEKFCSQLSTYYKRHMAFRSKRN